MIFFQKSEKILIILIKTVYLFIKEYLFMRNVRKIIKAKKEKNDEFYTRYEDIKKNMPLYNSMLKDKWVYCNADDETSNFWKYFYDNFNKIELRHLTATSIKNTYRLDYDGHIVTKSPLNEPVILGLMNVRKYLKIVMLLLQILLFLSLESIFPFLWKMKRSSL